MASTARIVGRDGQRCRLCTTNDIQGLVEQLAEDLWESRRHGTPDDWTWSETSEHWQRIFRELAETAVHSLHPHKQ